MLNNYVKKGQLLFLLSFAALIAVGTLLLMLPGIHREATLNWVDALFTATSAVCVTGLTVNNICDFSGVGQLILLFLMQLGGIGIMTLSSAILLVLGRGLSFSDTLLVSTLHDNFSLRGAESLTSTVIRYTLVSECGGLIIIYCGLLLGGGPWLGSIWNATFLSVSAFCNAGLAPFIDSLGGVHPLVKLGCSGLNILGGLGVYVIYDLLQVLRKRQKHLRVHSKVVLLTTLLLLIFGMCFLRLSGMRNGAPVPWLDAWFISASARTAGFTTVPIADLPEVSQMMLILLMLIGGSPGSTAGGMKTSTIAVAVAALLSTFKGDANTLMFKREIPTVNVMRAFAIIVSFILLACFGAMVVRILTPKILMLNAFFEAVSALTTTGLSIGNTTISLTSGGRIFITLFMFIGRVGPFTIMLFLLGREKPDKLRYPQERIIIG